jgi:hypothetical protein
MYRRNKQARLLTGGLIGALPVTTPGDEHWDDVSLLIRGDTLTDLSSNAHTLTAYGNAAAGDTSPVKFASGSLTFDGNGDYISIPDDPSLEVGSGDFTIECWAYHSGAMSSYSALMGKRSDGNEKSPYLFNADASNPEKMRFLASAGTNWDIILVDTAAFPTDQWVHVAATREGNTFTLWINGQSKATTTASVTLVDNSAPITLGRASETLEVGANEWKGNIEDFRVTKGVARYTGPFDPPTASFLTNKPVVGRRGVGSVDSGSPPITNAVDLDGTADYLTSSTLAASDRRTFTLSAWIKPSSLPASYLPVFSGMYVATGHNQQIHLGLEGGNLSFFEFDGTNFLSYLNTNTTPISVGTWHHVVFAIDTTAGSAGDRVKIWLDGSPQSLVLQGGASNYSLNYQTYMSAGTWPSTGVAQKFAFGAGYSFGNSTLYRQFPGQIADAHFIDGQALTADDFGEDVSGTWSAKAYTGTYGTNGFHLNFTDGANLGTDNSSNGNDFTEVSLTTSNQVAISTSDIPQVIPEATPLRTRGYIGAAPAGGGIAPADHFKAVTYTGSSSAQDVTVGFQPDFAWIKCRNENINHSVWDSVRGADKLLAADTTAGQTTLTDTVVTDADGMTLYGGYSRINSSTNGRTYVAWCLKAGGAGVSNTDGSITSTVSANVDAGFSVVTYTGTGAAATVGHGLNSAPELVMCKTLNITNQWHCGHTALGWSSHIHLDLTNAATGTSTAWNNTAPDSSVVNLGTSTGSNYSGPMLAYCFHSVPGFSKVGSYTGDGGTNNYVELGFRPAFVMVKRTDVAANWIVMDNARDPSNPVVGRLFPNSSSKEIRHTNTVDFNDSGFTAINNFSEINGTGGTYIYLAFAESNTLSGPGRGMLTLYDRYIDTLT